MRHLGVWVAEFFKLLGGRRLHPLTTQCPICQQMVRLHVNRAGRRHVFAHARAIYTTVPDFPRTKPPRSSVWGQIAQSYSILARANMNALSCPGACSKNNEGRGTMVERQAA